MLNAVLARAHELATARVWTMYTDDTFPAFQLAPEGPDTTRAREIRDEALAVIDALPAFRFRDATTGRPVAIIGYAPSRPAERDPEAVYGLDVLEYAKEAGLEAALADRFDLFGMQAVVVAPPGTTLPTETATEETTEDG